MKNSFFSVLLILLHSLIYSQIPVGSWRSHLPFAEASKVAKAENKVYCSTSGGLFYYNLKDNSINKVSKEDGLSDSEVTAIAYSKETRTLIIAYQTGNIDLITNSTIFNISYIKNKLLPGDKSINDICLDGGTAYLACGFGIVLLNLEKKEISETFFIGEGELN